MVIQQMALSEYADLQSQFGVKVIAHNGHYWRQVRPLFYRPLLPVEAYPHDSSRPPVTWPVGCQYVVADPQAANSTMNFIMLDNLAGYTLDGLLHKRRQLIKRAGRYFTVRPVTDPRELKEQGHRVYLSFLQRTGYPYKSDRKNKTVFGQWIDTLCSNPKTILMGGYGPDGLVAISTSYWINRTLVYSTLICDTDSMHKNVGELMFHEVRQMTAQHPGIAEIFVRGYQGGNSIDQYYLHRDCHLVRKPARLEMPVLTHTLLRWLQPRKYELLCGKD